MNNPLIFRDTLITVTQLHIYTWKLLSTTTVWSASHWAARIKGFAQGHFSGNEGGDFSHPELPWNRDPRWPVCNPMPHSVFYCMGCKDVLWQEPINHLLPTALSCQHKQWKPDDLEWFQCTISMHIQCPLSFFLASKLNQWKPSCPFWTPTLSSVSPEGQPQKSFQLKVTDIDHSLSSILIEWSVLFCRMFK